MNDQIGLADIHTLPAVSSWPPAIGWWLVALSAILLMAFLVNLVIKHQRDKRVLKLSLSYLEQLDSQSVRLNDLNLLLKRHLKSISLQHPALSLSGKAWGDYLMTQTPEAHRTTIQPLADALGESLYRPDTNQQSDLQPLITATRCWLTESWPTVKQGDSHA